MIINYKFMYLFLILSFVNVPSEFVEIFPFTFILSICFGLHQMTSKIYFNLFIKEVKNYILLMVASSLGLMFLKTTDIPMLADFDALTLNEQIFAAVKIYLQLCLFYSVLKISKHAHFMVYHRAYYVYFNIAKYIRSIPFYNNPKKLIRKNVNNLKAKTKLEKKYKLALLETMRSSTNRDNLSETHHKFILNNHPVLKEIMNYDQSEKQLWAEDYTKIMKKLKKGEFKNLVDEKNFNFPPAVPVIY